MVEKKETQNRMKTMLVGLAILFGIVVGIKMVKHLFFIYIISSQKHVVTVSTTKVSSSSWKNELQSVGSTRAIRGVDITTQSAGMVTKIYFQPGDYVPQGKVLVQLNADPEIGQLHSLQASVELAKINLARDTAQYKAQAVSKAVVDTDAATLKNYQAQVEQQQAIIAQKTIVAPFAGKLGISAVNPGQYLTPGNKVVTIQQLDPIWVDFYLPQQQLRDLKVGQVVMIKSDALGKTVLQGKITTIDPIVDVNTRNVQVEATIANEKLQLTPGMFVSVTVDLSSGGKQLILPQAAISYNSYGNIVYIVQHGKKGELTVKQHFVELGDTRGDQVAITSGVHEGEEVVTSGQLKLKNGSEISIDNSTVPSDSPNPAMPNER